MSRADLTLTANAGLKALLRQQKSRGDFEGEMVWCTMILAQAIIVRHLLGKPYSEEDARLIVRHFTVTQTDDGAWGMHPESPGYVFFTSIGYVALRLLGVEPQDPILSRARDWLHVQPIGVEGIPTWGKFWLALLGLYSYEDLNAIPPELFLLPEWLPFHPRRFYCHTRLIYLGLAYLSGRRFVANLDDTLRRQLRTELFGEKPMPSETLALRHLVAPGDVHVPITPLLRRIYDALAVFERRPFPGLRQRALDQCLDRILYEQRSTRYQGISPVNGLLNTLALFAADKDHPELGASLEGADAWRWVDEAEGLRYVGARSNTWDTAFVMQALLEVEQPDDRVKACLQRTHDFLDGAQIRTELEHADHYWRDPALGGWCFSDGEHRWPVSDCTAEALSALLSLYDHPAHKAIAPLPIQRLREAVEFILLRQNKDGGFGTYERRRAGKLLEWVNPSEMFGQCMTELSYLECTASSLAALVHYRRFEPQYRAHALEKACKKATRFLLDAQGKDGAWPGFWGINYTYGAFHVVRALRQAGLEASHPALRKASAYLTSIQRQEGGWGEHYSSCLQSRYIEHEQGQVVMTSWALLALLELEPSDHPSIQRGIMWLQDQQLASGDWPRQAVNGVFFGAAMLDYRLYHTYFPVWAVTRYNKRQGGAGCCEEATSVA